MTSRSVIATMVVVILILLGTTSYFALTPASTSVTVTASGTTTTTTVTAAGTTSAQPLKIAFVTTVTGYAAGQGKLMIEGFQMAVDEINARGGILGRPIQVILIDQDDKTDQAVAGAKSLVAQGAYAAIGFFWSGDVAAMEPDLSAGKIISIFNVASSPTLLAKVKSDYNNYKYFFRVIYNDSTIGTYSMPFLTDIAKAKSYYLMAEDYGWAHEVANTIHQLAQAKGIQVLGEDFFDASVTNYASTAVKISPLKPDVIVNIMSGDNAVGAVKDLKANPNTMKIPIFQPYSGLFGVQSTWQSMEKSQPGSTQYVTIGEYGLPTLAMTKKTVPFATTYQTKFGHPPTLAWSAPPYDSLYILANAITTANTFDKDAVIKALEQTDYVGTTGRVVFTSAHDLTYGAGYTIPIFEELVNLQPRAIWPPQLATGSWVDPRTQP